MSTHGAKEAYWVDENLRKLIIEGKIRKHRPYPDRDALLRYFEAHKIKAPEGYPQGDDLFRNEPFKSES